MKIRPNPKRGSGDKETNQGSPRILLLQGRTEAYELETFQGEVLYRGRCQAITTTTTTSRKQNEANYNDLNCY
jgi:hypothetical protein